MADIPNEKPTLTPSPPSPEELNPVESESVDMPRTRRTKLQENQAKRNIALTVAGIIVIIVLLVMFGVTALQKLSDVTIKEKDEVDGRKKVAQIIIPPTLEAPIDATNSAEVVISGSVQNGDTVKLYVNGAYTEKTELKGETSFTFENVTLKNGLNKIKAKVISEKKESDFSQEIRISYFDEPPLLEIVSPADGRTFRSENNPVKVAGKTSSNARVTVNDHRAIMEADGNFEYSLQLTSGDNDIKVISTDEAGNTTEKHLKVILE